MNQAVTEKCPVTNRVADYIANALERPLPNEVVQKTKCHLLDTIAAIISGARLKAGRLAAEFVGDLGGRPEATVIGTPIVSSAVQAAFANAMAAHADETDDSHLGGLFHPGCAIVPAALAISESNNRSGTHLVRAIALGYDIGARFNKVIGVKTPRAASHSTHSLGTVFGAAAAAGALLNLSTQQAIFLLSYATQQASGVPYWNRDSDHVEKAFDFAGMGARNGIYAALMVRAGFTGVSDPLLGNPSYLTAFAKSPRPEEFTSGLGERFEIMDASIKKWCVGSPIQAALDALMVMVNTHGLHVDELESMTVRMPDDRLPIVDNREMPDICLQHLLAIGLIDRDLTFDSCHDKARMNDPEVLDLRRKIKAVPDPMLTEAKPARQAILEATKKNGETLRHRTYAVLGTPDNPMSQEEISKKCLDLMVPVLGRPKAEELMDVLWEIESLDSLASLRELLLV